MAAPDRLRLALDHIAEALDDLTALTAGQGPKIRPRGPGFCGSPSEENVSFPSL